MDISVEVREELVNISLVAFPEVKDLDLALFKLILFSDLAFLVRIIRCMISALQFILLVSIAFAAWLIFGVLGIMFSNFGEWAINPIKHFKHLFRRASFIPINAEFIQLMCWAVFIGWALYRIKCAIHHRNNRD